jgi:uncharacterized protein
LKTAIKIRVAFLLLLALSLSSCSGNFKKVKFSSAEKQSYLEQINRFRERKDLFFRSNLSSPLTQAQRVAFRQLNYYQPDFDLIFTVKLLKESSPKRIGMQATGGETRAAVKYGRFKFEIAGKKLSLFVYKMEGDDSNELFVPFTDETCGKTSYSGGRYIDLTQNESGEYILDFNYAYNPYCAYNHNYSCPIVPQENHLDASIEAGEMKY